MAESGRRRTLERAWEHWREGSAPEQVRPEILSSWERSAEHLPATVEAAPLADEGETATLFAESPLSAAVNRLEGAHGHQPGRDNQYIVTVLQQLRLAQLKLIIIFIEHQRHLTAQ